MLQSAVLRRLLLFICLLLLAGCFTASFADSAQVQVQSYSQLFACSSLGCGGIFQGMKGGSVVNGNLTGGQVITLMCIDFQNDTFIPSTVYSANFSSITDGSDISLTRFGGATDPVGWTFNISTFNYTGGSVSPDALGRYQMVAYLTSLYNSPGADNDAIQSAIWQIMESNPPSTGVFIVPGSSTFLSTAAEWLATTSASAKNALLSQFRVVTNLPPLSVSGAYPNQIQEFLTTVTPEPAFFGVLLFGMGWLFIAARKKAHAQQI
jgi:hypothetical protein